MMNAQPNPLPNSTPSAWQNDGDDDSPETHIYSL